MIPIVFIEGCLYSATNGWPTHILQCGHDIFIYNRSSSLDFAVECDSKSGTTNPYVVLSVIQMILAIRHSVYPRK